ncbi:MAG: exodeoxyribonuclease III [Deltaproteobacteria bacterium]|nr:exodeoxyribonuclease III [Deltaproteobacteria bacterium]
MRIATWNVNSVRARLPHLLDWLDATRPDVVCLQETKVTDADFPRSEIEARGFGLAVHGQKTWNGVAILSRVGLQDVQSGLPGFEDPRARVLAATVGPLRVVCLYAPMGEAVGSEKYAYKLNWYDALLRWVTSGPGRPDVLAGDLNVAPDDRDVWDPALLAGTVLVSEPERARFRALLETGYHDALRVHTEESGIYTWWDYRAAAFRRKMGMRLDHVLVSTPLVPRIANVRVHRDMRAREATSDHAPLDVDLREP